MMLFVCRRMVYSRISNGTYQAYDKKNGEIMDVDVFNFKADNMFFKMPVGIDAVGAGDLIVFNRKPCFVFGFSEQGDVIVIDIALGEKKTILPTKSPLVILMYTL